MMKNYISPLFKLSKQIKYQNTVSLTNNSIKKFSIQSDGEDDIIDPYTVDRMEDYQSLYQMNYIGEQRIPGKCDKEGTTVYSKRNKAVSKNHFRTPQGSELLLSSIGFGTYGMQWDETTDKLMFFNSFIDAVQSGGCNVLDTSINCMGMSGERIVGATLRYLQKSQNIQRNELFLSTKHGKVTEDTDQGYTGPSITNEMIKNNKIKESDISERKCFHPEFLKLQFETSLQNMGVEALDLVYLNEPTETQFSPEKQYDYMARAFEYYQSRIQENQLQYYGVDSWSGFRSNRHQEQVYISLQKLNELAIKVAGKDNGFKFIQLPLSLIMPDALTDEVQTIYNEKGEKEQDMTIFSAAVKYGININTKCSLEGAVLHTEEIAEKHIDLDSNIARHIQLSRSAPSQAKISTVLQPNSEEKIRLGMEVMNEDPLEEDEIKKIYKKYGIKPKNLN